MRNYTSTGIPLDKLLRRDSGPLTGILHLDASARLTAEQILHLYFEEVWEDTESPVPVPKRFMFPLQGEHTEELQLYVERLDW